ncbi:MAG: hypothetical protein HFJ55_04835 [Clostridia bacterium]|nr:hypothetical protein [Clostridia bacterium]
MINTETRAAYVIGDLILAGFSEREIKTVLIFGTKFMKDPESQEKAEVLGEILEANGISEYDLTKFFKRDRSRVETVQPVYYEVEKEDGSKEKLSYKDRPSLEEIYEEKEEKVDELSLEEEKTVESGAEKEAETEESIEESTPEDEVEQDEQEQEDEVEQDEQEEEEIPNQYWEDEVEMGDKDKEPLTLEEKLRGVIKTAKEAGIPEEKLRAYLRLDDIVAEEEQETLNEIYRKYDFWASDIFGREDKEEFIDRILYEDRKPQEELQPQQEEPEQEDIADEQDGQNREEETYSEETLLSEKSQKLVDKVNELTQRIEEEPNRIKRHILSFQVRMLISRLQKEIDLNNIKEYYQQEREAAKRYRDKMQDKGVDNIAAITEKIRLLEKVIYGNEEYDIKSKYFMYPKEYVEDIGGVKNLVDKLKQSDKSANQRAASRIEEVSKKRAELEDLRKELEDNKMMVEDAKEYYKEDMKSINKEEKSLVVRQKMNIFSRIGNFFKNAMDEISQYRQERHEEKELRTSQLRDEAQLNEQYEKDMAELRAKYNDMRANLREYHGKETEQDRNVQNQSKAASFREQMSQVINQEEPSSVKESEEIEQDIPEPEQEDDER